MPLTLGTRLGSYEITDRLGSGGMGEVYRAKDLKLGRDVAVKVLREELATDAERLRRFEQEARSASALNHPNIITIYDIGKHQATPFIAMEYVEGKTLREMLGEGPLPTKKLLQFATQIAEGLAKAHSAGIVHRDLKPENVMVTSDGYVKILDFGLAKLRTLPSGTDSKFPTMTKESTAPGLVMGTVGYMSPEQAKGQPADFRSDQFSFGAIIYEIVTGKRAFQRDSAVQTLSAIIEQEPESIAAIHPDAPAQLRAIVERCLAKTPEERYDSTRDLARELKSLEETASQPPSEFAAARIPKRRMWPRLLAIGGGLAAVCALILVLNGGRTREWLATGPSPRIESIAVLPLENLSGDPEQDYFVDGMTEALITDLAKIGALKVISRTSVMQYKGVKRPLPEIARELNVDAVIEGSVLPSGGRVRITAQLIQAATDQHLWAESYERDLSDILALQRDVARAIAGEIELELTPREETRLGTARAVDPAAHNAYLRGRYFWNQRTEEGNKKALEYFQQAIELEPDYALAYAGLADAYLFSTEPSPAEATRRVRAAANKALEIDGTLAEARTTLAFATIFDWQWEAAESGFRRAIELNPSYATAHHWYGLLLSWTGRHEEAIAEMKRARELDPLSLIISTALGGTFYLARQYDQAIEHHRKTLEMDENFHQARMSLADAYLQKGMFEAAKAELQWVVDRDPKPFSLAALGRAYALAGDQAEAEKILTQVDESWFISAPFYAAKIYVALGQEEKALQFLEKASEEDPNVVYLKTDPSFDPLRSDPRFQDLLRRLNFPD